MKVGPVEIERLCSIFPDRNRTSFRLIAQSKTGKIGLDPSPHGVLVNKGFGDGSELLLLATRELGGGFEKLFHLAGWTSAAFLSSVRTHQIFHRNIERFGQAN